MNTFNLKFANRVGIFFVAVFAICFAWFYFRPIEQDLHLKLFKLAFFGFSEMNGLAFLLGAVQTYLWAYVGVGLWQVVSILTNKK